MSTQTSAERLREIADMYCRGVQAFVDLRRIADEIEQRDSDVDGWTQTVTVDGSRQRWELPAEKCLVEFEHEGEMFKGDFNGCGFHGRNSDGKRGVGTSPVRVTRWRPVPPPAKEPELPEFVTSHFFKTTVLNDESVRKVLAPLFRFPHDPPRVGDERLVVETWPSTHAAASAENLKHLKRITTLEADRDELLRLLERAVSPGTGRYMSDGWLKDALAAIERQKGGG